MVKSSKVAFIFPGYRESADQKVYKSIARAFLKQNIAPVRVSVEWKRRTMSQYTETAFKLVQDHPANEKYLLGFSFGAYICFLLATQLKVKSQILCSLSPYFTEEVSLLKKSWKSILGKKRIKDFTQYSYRTLGRNVTSPTTIIFGDQEVIEVKRVCLGLYKALASPKSLVVIAGAKHNIRQPVYLTAVCQVIKKL